MNTKTALVTGAGGFIGGHLCEHLLSRGWDVTAVDWKECKDWSLRYEAGIRCRVLGCMSVKEFVRDFNDSFSAIFHLAATPRIGRSFERPADVLENNLGSAAAMLDYALKHGCRMVFASSSTVHSPLEDSSPYSLSKVFCESMCEYYISRGADVKIARIFSAYGPGQPETGDTALLIGRLECAMRTGGSVTLFSEGAQKRDFTHVADVCQRLIWLAETEAQATTWELGNGEPLSVMDVAAAFLPREQIHTSSICRRGDVQETCADPTMMVPLDNYPIFLYDYAHACKQEHIFHEKRHGLKAREGIATQPIPEATT